VERYFWHLGNLSAGSPDGQKLAGQLAIIFFGQPAKFAYEVGRKNICELFADPGFVCWRIKQATGIEPLLS
jgi:hypothetical protein